MSLIKKPLFEKLNGLVCIFKNQGQPVGLVTSNFQLKLLNGFYESRKKELLPPLIKIHEENVGTKSPVVTLQPDFSSHELGRFFWHSF